MKATTSFIIATLIVIACIYFEDVYTAMFYLVWRTEYLYLGIREKEKKEKEKRNARPSQRQTSNNNPSASA